MMDPVPRLDATQASPVAGRVRISPAKLVWFGGHALVASTAPFVFSWGALAAFGVLTWTLVLLGHSLGYHRLLMHGNFKTSRGLGRVFLVAGALLGSAGPSAIIRVHDERDWAQRAPDCHPYYSQHGPFWQDLVWQLFCDIELDRPPRNKPDPVWGDDAFACHLDRWWRVWALLPAVPLFLTGGLGWVVWGVSVRIVAVNAGHWMVNHICHHPGLAIRRWDVPANGVQANDLLRPNRLTGWLAGMLTAGECWHSNHHAFPESANTALGPDQVDPGHTLLKWMERRGWVWDVREPRTAQSDLDIRQPASLPQTAC